MTEGYDIDEELRKALEDMTGKFILAHAGLYHNNTEEGIAELMRNEIVKLVRCPRSIHPPTAAQSWSSTARYRGWAVNSFHLMPRYADRKSLTSSCNLERIRFIFRLLSLDLVMTLLLLCGT